MIADGRNNDDAVGLGRADGIAKHRQIGDVASGRKADVDDVRAHPPGVVDSLGHVRQVACGRSALRRHSTIKDLHDHDLNVPSDAGYPAAVVPASGGDSGDSSPVGVLRATVSPMIVTDGSIGRA